MFVWRFKATAISFKEGNLKLRGGVELGLNGVQLHPQVLFVHLDGVAAFPLDLLLNQHLGETQPLPFRK